MSWSYGIYSSEHPAEVRTCIVCTLYKPQGHCFYILALFHKIYSRYIRQCVCNLAYISFQNLALFFRFRSTVVYLHCLLLRSCFFLLHFLPSLRVALSYSPKGFLFIIPLDQPWNLLSRSSIQCVSLDSPSFIIYPEIKATGENFPLQLLYFWIVETNWWNQKKHTA